MAEKRPEFVAVCRKIRDNDLDTSECYCMDCFDKMLPPLDLTAYYGVTKPDLDSQKTKCKSCGKIITFGSEPRWEMFWKEEVI